MAFGGFILMPGLPERKSAFSSKFMISNITKVNTRQFLALTVW